MREYDPELDQSHNLRDELAGMATIVPAFLEQRELAAAYLGLKPEEYDPLKHMALAWVKWRYQCADAALLVRDAPRFYERPKGKP